MGLLDLWYGGPSAPNPLIVFFFQFAIAAFLAAWLFVMAARISHTRNPPSKQPTGWHNIDYDANKINRKSLSTYMSQPGGTAIPDTTPMVKFSVATANFGGIFTEDIGFTKPWIGTVSPDAARLQVEAGARAIVFDIWPDPADLSRPIVASMLDMNAWTTMHRWYADWGLNRGVGRYSNWQRLTRNSMPVGEVIGAATTAAFDGVSNPQAGDPFFLILNLHGAMTIPYLNYLGNAVNTAISGHAMGPEWNKANGQGQLCSEPVSSFMNKAFVIVCPDVQPGYNILPNVNTWSDFATSFLQNTQLGQITNALEKGAYTIKFEPSNIAPLTVANQASCVTGAPPITLPSAGFCLVQPSIGGQDTDNKALFNSASYTDCLATGAQFVAVNLFSSNDSDPALTTFFDPAQFGTYSFKKGA